MEPEVYTRHLENEESHWWFKGRREIICSVIKKILEMEIKKLTY